MVKKQLCKSDQLQPNKPSSHQHVSSNVSKEDIATAHVCRFLDQVLTDDKADGYDTCHANMNKNEQILIMNLH